MAINKKMEDAINEQINAELYSAYLYMSMASWFENRNLMGFTNWMKCQYMEETMHGMKFYNFLNDRGGRAVLKAIDTPSVEWNNPLEVFEEVYAHEQKVTSLINNLVSIAKDIRDYASESLLMWFVDEQVEEEASADEIVNRLKLIKDDASALLMLDQELKARALSPLAVPTILGQPGGA